MGQKSNPIALRLNINRSFDSCWYNDYSYTQCVSRDLLVEKFLESVFKKKANGPTSRIFMREVAKKLTVTAFFHNAKRTRLKRMERFSDKPYFIKRKKKKILYSRTHGSTPPREVCNKNKLYFPFIKSCNSTPQTAPLTSTSKPYPTLEKNGKWEMVNAIKSPPAQRRRFPGGQLETKRDSLVIAPVKSVMRFGANPAPNLGNLFASRYMLVQSRVAQLENKKMQIPATSIPKQWMLSLPHAFVTKKVSSELQRAENPFRSSHYVTPSLREDDKRKAVVQESYRLANWRPQKKISPGNPFITHIEKLVSKTLAKSVPSHISERTNMVHFHPYRVTSEFQSAQFIAEEIVYYLGRGINFRQIKNQISKEIKNVTKNNYAKLLKGLRISCSGRLGGRSKKAQRSRTLSARFGSVPLHVFSDKIDYAYKQANTRFGVMGIKVWACYK